MGIIFFDFEVFKYDWFVVFKQDGNFTKIHNDVDKLKRYYIEHVNDVYVGYNCRHYDQYIYKAILKDMNPYHVSNSIINKKLNGWEVVPEAWNIQLNFYDPILLNKSLKLLEGFMGHSIYESDVPWDVDRPLNSIEILDTFMYCKHDVNEVEEVFRENKDDWNTKVLLLKAFGLPTQTITKTNAQLSAIILGAKKQKRNDEFDIQIVDTLRLSKYANIKDWFTVTKNYNESLDIMIDNTPHVIGWGGLHGAKTNIIKEGIIISIDVDSYYPALMIEYGFLSRNVNNPDEYKKIRDDRIEKKRKKDPQEKALKLLLNSTYGASKDKYNNLFDPLQANNVCVNGQLLLIDLIEKLEGHWELIQSNTDGLIGIVETLNDIEIIKNVYKSWEKRTGMNLKLDIYNKIIQKDVNNYVLIGNNSVKTKGSYVKKPTKLDNNLAVVKNAIINYLVENIPIEETIQSTTTLIDFQYIKNLGKNYKCFYLCDNKEDLLEHNKIDNKCIRIFASNTGKSIFKLKECGQVAKLEGTPTKCKIINDNIINLKVTNDIDKNWYVNLANDWLKQILGG